MTIMMRKRSYIMGKCNKIEDREKIMKNIV